VASTLIVDAASVRAGPPRSAVIDNPPHLAQPQMCVLWQESARHQAVCRDSGALAEASAR
jgi:hypothetical protein